MCLCLFQVIVILDACSSNLLSLSVCEFSSCSARNKQARTASDTHFETTDNGAAASYFALYAMTPTRWSLWMLNRPSACSACEWVILGKVKWQTAFRAAFTTLRHFKGCKSFSVKGCRLDFLSCPAEAASCCWPSTCALLISWNNAEATVLSISLQRRPNLTDLLLLLKIRPEFLAKLTNFCSLCGMFGNAASCEKILAFFPPSAILFSSFSRKISFGVFFDAFDCHTWMRRPTWVSHVIAAETLSKYECQLLVLIVTPVKPFSVGTEHLGTFQLRWCSHDAHYTLNDQILFHSRRTGEQRASSNAWLPSRI